MDPEAMKTPSPKPLREVILPRKGIHEQTSGSGSEILDTNPVRPKRANTDNVEKSFNETREISGRIEDEEVTDDDEYAEERTDNLQLRRSVEPEPPRQIALKSSIEPPTPKEVNQPPKNIVFLALVAVVVAALAVVFGKEALPHLMARFGARKEPSVRQSCTKFLQLHSKYPNTDDMLWTTLIVGVERAVNDPGEPATFIFLYDSSSVGQSLLYDVTHITIDCFGNNEGAIWRTSDDFKPAEIAADYGMALDRHRAELQSQGVLVVRDLDRVPPKAAPVFFTICDAYEPLVRKAVIFFTIDISQRNNQSEQSPTSMAERILKDLWRKELNENVLDPLVVRLTENVFQIE